jgi:hypothetical protein
MVYRPVITNGTVFGGIWRFKDISEKEKTKRLEEDLAYKNILLKDQITNSELRSQFFASI